MYVNYDMHNAELYKYTYTLLLNLIITYTTNNTHVNEYMYIYIYVCIMIPHTQHITSFNSLTFQFQLNPISFLE